jgi:hypothetical protein
MNDSRSGLGSLHMPRSRGAVSGLLLIILGIWGALVPFVGHYFHFAYTPGPTWTWSTARGVLEVFPGAVTAVGGFLLLVSGNRATAMFGGWLATIAGAWFVVGRELAPTLHIEDIGAPTAATDIKRALLEIGYFSGLGALIVFLGGAVLARLSVRSVRDAEFASQADSAPAADAHDAFATPAAPIDPAAPTQELNSAAPQSHRREGKAGFFRRRRAGVAGNN